LIFSFVSHLSNSKKLIYFSRPPPLTLQPLGATTVLAQTLVTSTEAPTLQLLDAGSHHHHRTRPLRVDTHTILTVPKYPPH
jgi:hypothetical protein